VAAIEGVIPDISIDRGMADGKDLVGTEPAGYLLRAPFQAEQAKDDLQVAGGETPIAA